ncbi:ribonuclease HII [Desulfovibrio oxamicus]|uniref:Ribonuclease n=1 Tax=Nitratidesulfovibrio oxamicus TaxID=32016 RepID=A0ABS0J879_9BACT|nr:ribonuclease HII [Nitratidesulfovibrio oxamicus]MBG3878680.1 ribonuclease HII [Nitratidesulfovibrio oxamicus]
MAPLHPATPYIGIDEAGRGCLAGPVVAAAVILPPHADAATLAALLPDLSGLTDSKKLTAAKREALAPRIRQHAVAWGLGVVWPRDIERINILQATFHAMWRAVRFLRPGHAARDGANVSGWAPAPLTDLHGLPSVSGKFGLSDVPLIIDGDKTIPAAVFAGQPPRPVRSDQAAPATPFPAPVQRAVVGGDALVPAVSAASILAKTFRDQFMTALDRRFPHYGLAVHKGYGTAEHMAAIAEHGPCPQHRVTFRGVRPEPPQTQGSLL